MLFQMEIFHVLFCLNHISFLYLSLQSKTNQQSLSHFSHIHLPFFSQINPMSLISNPFYYTKTGDCLEINKLNKPRQNSHWLIEVLCLFVPFLCHLYKGHLFFGASGLIHRPTWTAKYCDNIIAEGHQDGF